MKIRADENVDRICPKCSFTNTLAAKVCRCGYSLRGEPGRDMSSTSNPQNSNSPVARVDPGEAQAIRTLRLVAGLSVGVFIGIVLLVMEVSSSSVTAWGIDHPILLIVCCAGLLIAGKRGWF